MARITPNDEGAPLALATLGVAEDNRPLPELEPERRKGIHLRWAFVRERGFPWYGFYLLRRPTPNTASSGCIASDPALQSAPPGPTSSKTLTVGLGKFEGNAPITLTEDFPVAGSREIDLSNQGTLTLRMSSSNPKSRVDLKIGFVSDFPSTDGGGGGSGSGDGDGDDGDKDLPGGGLGGDPDDTTVPEDGGGPNNGGGLGDDDSGDGGSAGGGGRGGSSCGCECEASSVTPVVERVVYLGNGTYRVTYGYVSSSATAVAIPVGPQNQFVPGAPFLGQPTLFLPGTHHNVFSVTFSGRPLAWTLGGVTTIASSGDAERPTASDGILIVALRGDVPVAYRSVAGRAGEIVAIELPFEAIDTVTISGGPARLVDLCAVPAGSDVTLDWEPAPGFPQPMCLPVRHPDYPCRPGTVNRDESEDLALERITYGPKSLWEGENFTAIHDALKLIVQGGPGVKSITDHVDQFDVEPEPVEPDAPKPEPADQSYLDLLLTASIHPAVAQMLGLYWVDESAAEGQSYDYMLVADYGGAGGSSIATISSLVLAGDFTHIDCYVKSGARRSVTPELEAPENVRGYVLPVGAIPPGAPGDAAGLVGLRWDVNITSKQRLEPESAILFHVWRKDFGATRPPDPAPAHDHARVTDLALSANEALTRDPDPRITDWPAFGLFAVDGPLVEGWYGYRVSGVDIFGRHSTRSDAAAWFDVDNVTEQHPNACNPVDRRPPPAPADVRAWVLDPQDPWVFVDDAYTAFRAQHSDAIGLRVRWTFDGKQMAQAPDTREFRIYLQPGSSMADASNAAVWSQRVAIVGFDEKVIDERVVPMRSIENTDLEGSSATASGASVTLLDGPTLEAVALDALELELPGAPGARKRFAVLAIDVETRTLTLDAAPGLSGTSSWTLGVRERTYEVFLPGNLAVPPVFSLPLATSATTPIAYALVGVSAVDDKASASDPRGSGSLAPRPGNEGPVGGPATVVLIHRVVPSAPAPVFPGDRLLATRADFDGHSFFMLHFPKSEAEPLSTHVFRALDQTLFMIDQEKGFMGTPRNGELMGSGLYPAAWSTAERLAVRTEINALGSAAGYATLSDRALRVLASLPSNATAFSCLTAEPLPPDTPDVAGPNDAVDYPTNSTSRGAHLDRLDGRSQNRYFYRTSYVDAAHNQSVLGPSSPPVYLPPTVLPETPLVERGVAKPDTTVEITWLASRSPAVVAYRVYRTDVLANARDVRLMDLVEEVPEVPLPTRLAKRTFSDDTVRGLVTYVYRVVAIDSEGFRSGASQPVRIRAIDTALPVVPALTAAWVELGGVARAELGWSSDDETALQQRLDGSPWLNVSGWLPAGEHSIRDELSNPDRDFEYRLIIKKYTGAVSRGAPITLIRR